MFELKDNCFGVTLIELLFKGIEKIFDVCYDSGSDMEMAIASGLYITVIENYQEIDDVVKYIIRIVYSNIEKSKSKVMLKMHLQIVNSY